MIEMVIAKKNPLKSTGVELLAEQLHIWYLEASKKMNPESYNKKAQVPYEELSEEQKFLDRYIATKILGMMK